MTGECAFAYILQKVWCELIFVIVMCAWSMYWCHNNGMIRVHIVELKRNVYSIV